VPELFMPGPPRSDRAVPFTLAEPMGQVLFDTADSITF
jgi:hypothetical protein